MEHTALEGFMTGVAVPLFSLRTKHSCGVGEYPDLVDLAAWCGEAGITMVQTLPLNDTGGDNSPYSALGAFALHPVYLRLDPLVSPRLLPQVAEFRGIAEGHSRFDYAGVTRFKDAILQETFDADADNYIEDPGFTEWIDRNPWVHTYAAYRTLKSIHDQTPWWQWPREEVENPETACERTWHEHRRQTRYHAWLQYQCHEQLCAARKGMQDRGVFLKGDIPILMNRDSADVWRYPDLFDQTFQAGAPPDMFSPLGQNWGFPVYAWEKHREDGFRWWRARVARAAEFYHAFRIDHVLGFFRIWRIPERDTSGVMGHYFPAADISTARLKSLFSDERLRWLSRPHVRDDLLDDALGDHADRVRRDLLQPVGDGSSLLFSREAEGESLIREAGGTPEAVDFLLARYRDRALQQTGSGSSSPASYAPAWYYSASTAYASLDDGERKAFENLVHGYYQESEPLWEKNAAELLTMLQSASGMLVCAEDLGVVPDCVPVLLKRLGILGLRVQRWARRYDEPGKPFIHPRDYPRLSVATSSVHDTTPLRGWWAESPQERVDFFQSLGLPGTCPAHLDPKLCDAVLRALAQGNSRICVFQIQDLFALTPDLIPPDPSEERINIPGTQGPHNWSYRIPTDIQGMRDHPQLTRRVTAACSRPPRPKGP